VPKTSELLKDAFQLKKYPLAQLLSSFEQDSAAARTTRSEVIAALDEQSAARQKDALMIGITGSPGAGKSTLINALCLRLLERQEDLSIAVLAVDPSSAVSGGSLLGDRTRTTFPTDEPRLFFRSQASNLELGGISHQTFQATRLLRRLFDLVFIETVGIGQSEMEIQRLADHTLLVLQPLAGDQVQFIKAGIMEQPDGFIVNKCDAEALANQSYELLRSSLKVARIATQSPPIFLTSAESGRGLAELVEHLSELQRLANNRSEREQQELQGLANWVKTQWGLRGQTRYLTAAVTAEGLAYEAREAMVLAMAETDGM